MFVCFGLALGFVGQAERGRVKRLRELVGPHIDRVSKGWPMSRKEMNFSDAC